MNRAALQPSSVAKPRRTFGRAVIMAALVGLGGCTASLPMRSLSAASARASSSPLHVASTAQPRVRAVARASDARVSSRATEAAVERTASPAPRPPASPPATGKLTSEQSSLASRASEPRVADARCYTQLRRRGVSFTALKPNVAPGVDYPMRLSGMVGNVEFRGGKPSAPSTILDCRLAQALLEWAPILERQGVVRVDHYSMYRRNATIAGSGRVSSHASAFAIDAARFHLSDGRVLSVLDDWEDKRRGKAPCGALARRGDDEERLLRGVVCSAANAGIFQRVITPHYNAAHDNHVHLEITDVKRPAWVR